MNGDDLRKVRTEYQSTQARDERFQALRERLQKPSMLLKLSIVIGVGLVCGIWSLYQMVLRTH